MSNPIITIHNAQTGEIITREMNAEELAQYEADQLAAAEAENKALEVEAKRQALLERLGITEEEAKLLLS